MFVYHLHKTGVLCRFVRLLWLNLFVVFTFCLCLLADRRVTISPTTLLSESTFSVPPAEENSTLPSETSNSSTLTLSPNQSSVQSDSKLEVITEDENLNVKPLDSRGKEGGLSRQDTVVAESEETESDKEKLTKKQNEKEQLSPPPEPHPEPPHTPAGIDDTISEESDSSTVIEETFTEGDSDAAKQTDEALKDSAEITVDIRAPWEAKRDAASGNEETVEGSALRDALSLIDNLGSDEEEESDSDSEEDEIIVCSPIKGSEVDRLRGEFACRLSVSCFASRIHQRASSRRVYLLHELVENRVVVVP